jgi:hypothetical protein
MLRMCVPRKDPSPAGEKKKELSRLILRVVGPNTLNAMTCSPVGES